MVQHMRFEAVDAVVGGAHGSSAATGRVYMDAASSVGAFEGLSANMAVIDKDEQVGHLTTG